MEINPFPASDFDDWASTYDRSVLDEAQFPFIGYHQALDTVACLAAPQPGMRVLDLGTGTGNLAALFASRGCFLWGTDFSAKMLAEARRKLPSAQFLQADLCLGWPAALPPTFERIVSAYVFHHFDLIEKVSLSASLAQHLAPQGKLLIADIAFPDQGKMEEVRRMAADVWDDEYYWIADQSIAALHQAGLLASFMPVSICAGVFVMEKR
ncbi:MAG: class I SAM-dependent methyltransferase [Anaerolineales bacterium]|nr:class I SAM-dependent methyltransferase [Anaerolineales bacterium]